jgi:large subunit ribosomal protein L17
MRHGVKTNRLGRDRDHRRALVNNLATSILRQGLNEEQMERSIVTTLPKAKVVRGLVDRLITYAKKGDLAARRQAARFVKEPIVLQGLFETLAPRYAARPGGYTRVLRMSENRRGDAAVMAMVTLVEDEVTKRTKKKPARAKAKAGVKKVDITQKETAAEAVANAPDAAGASEDKSAT